MWLASYMVRFREQLQTRWWGLLKPMAMAGGIVLLLLVQPDFGSAALLCAIAGGMVCLGGVRIRYLFALGMLAMPMLAWAALSESYRVKRLTSFMDPWADPFADGFQLTQALIAIGRGEWFGVGLGGSIQKLFYLPEAHTDFILAVIAEELGFAGIVLVVGLFLRKARATIIPAVATVVSLLGTFGVMHLLGYGFERSLHDARLDEFIDDFRDMNIGLIAEHITVELAMLGFQLVIKLLKQAGRQLILNVAGFNRAVVTLIN